MFSVIELEIDNYIYIDKNCEKSNYSLINKMMMGLRDEVETLAHQITRLNLVVIMLV